MKDILRKKLSLFMLPLCLLAITSCGNDDDDDKNDAPVLEQAPTPTTDTNAPATTFTKHCRKADEVPGGNFQFDWSDPLPGQIRRLSFNTGKNLGRIDVQGVSGERVQGEYTPVPAPEGEQGSFGELRFREFALSFPVIPTGNIRGSEADYAIGNLNAGETSLGTYLCSPSLLRELGETAITP